jgi:AMMECR1 domain-containing protein
MACRRSPLFVTWNKYDHAPEPKTESDENDEGQSEDDEESGPHLRGCIGTFSPMPLEEGLMEYAKIR